MKILNVLIFTLLFFNKVFGVVYTTISDGDWSDPTNWVGGLVPPTPLSSSDNIVMNHNMELTGVITISGTVTGTGSLDIKKGGSLTNNGSFTISGALNLTGQGNSNFGNGGIFINNSNGVVNIGSFSATHPATLFYNHGDITVSGDFALSGTLVNRFINYPTGFIDIGGTFSTQSNTNYNNQGVIHADIMDFAANTSTINDGTLYAKSSFTVANGNASSFSSPSGTGFIFSDGPTDLGSGNFTNMNFCNSNGTSPADADGNPNEDGIDLDEVNQNGGSGNSICGQPLPIKIFNISYTSDGIVLEWSSDKPMDIDHFIIQKSRDGLFWVDVDEVSVNDSNLYSYTDPNPHTSISYYRIVEVVGDYKYYNAIGVVEYGDKEILLYPNPVRDILILEPNSRGTFELRNLSGNSLLNVVFEWKIIYINVSEVSSGMYYAIITNRYGEKTIKKIIIQ